MIRPEGDSVNPLAEYAASFVAKEHFGEEIPPSCQISMPRIAIEHVAIVLKRHKNGLIRDTGSPIVDGFNVESLYFKFLKAAYGKWDIIGEAGTTLNQGEVDYLLSLKDSLENPSKLEVRQIKKITREIKDRFDDSRKNEEEELNPVAQKNLIKRIIEKPRKILHGKLNVGKDAKDAENKKSIRKKIAESGFFPPRW